MSNNSYFNQIGVNNIPTIEHTPVSNATSYVTPSDQQPDSSSLSNTPVLIPNLRKEYNIDIVLSETTKSKKTKK